VELRCAMEFSPVADNYRQDRERLWLMDG
jgi:hypothetical protein